VELIAKNSELHPFYVTLIPKNPELHTFYLELAHKSPDVEPFNSEFGPWNVNVEAFNPALEVEPSAFAGRWAIAVSPAINNRQTFVFVVR
jgi:hypothetical protein